MRDRAGETAEAIGSLLEEPTSAALLAAYYEPGGPFAASTFELLGNNHPERITVDDLLALTLLDVSVPPDTLRRALGPDSESLSDHLRDVGPDVPLWDATDERLAAADRLWQIVRKYRGVDWVIAGKLIARKRPQLVPVVDRWTEKALPATRGAVWETLRYALRQADLPDRIEALRPGTAATQTSTLRLLDALIWMRHSESKNARAVRIDLGLEVTPR
jgi:hypothetical protein